jgi:hypothetical protein
MYIYGSKYWLNGHIRDQIISKKSPKMSTPRILMTWQNNSKDFLCFRLFTLYVFRLCKHMNTLYSPTYVKLFPVCNQVWITDFRITYGPIKSDRVIVKIVWHTYCQIPAIFCYTESSCYGNYITPWISRNLPKPECSTELNITTASIFPVYFPENYYEIIMGP